MNEFILCNSSNITLDIMKEKGFTFENLTDHDEYGCYGVLEYNGNSVSAYFDKDWYLDSIRPIGDNPILLVRDIYNLFPQFESINECFDWEYLVLECCPKDGQKWSDLDEEIQNKWMAEWKRYWQDTKDYVFSQECVDYYTRTPMKQETSDSVETTSKTNERVAEPINDNDDLPF